MDASQLARLDSVEPHSSVELEVDELVSRPRRRHAGARGRMQVIAVVVVVVAVFVVRVDFE